MIEDFLVHLPSTPIGWLSLFFAGVVASLLLMNRVRSNDLTVLRTSNQDLRDALEDNIKKTTEMEVRIEELDKRIKELQGQNKTLQDIVTSALKQYFIENPGEARKLNKQLQN
jgi:predicted nuclease with TOPRIM domain